MSPPALSGGVFNATEGLSPSPGDDAPTQRDTNSTLKAAEYGPVQVQNAEHESQTSLGNNGAGFGRPGLEPTFSNFSKSTTSQSPGPDRQDQVSTPPTSSDGPMSQNIHSQMSQLSQLSNLAAGYSHLDEPELCTESQKIPPSTNQNSSANAATPRKELLSPRKTEIAYEIGSTATGQKRTASGSVKNSSHSVPSSPMHSRTSSTSTRGSQVNCRILLFIFKLIVISKHII
jgi:hypothetical protein